ncbi:MAG: MFS transporter [Lachnospiraceae bacterium]|nr:MFS transporter [Lachnospiraceae bacterium]
MEDKKLTSIFRNKNYSLVFFGALVTNIGSLFYSFTVSFYILEITNNNAALQGTYLAVCSIVYLITSLFGGVMSDNYHKARIMFICDYMKGVLILFATLGLFLMQENVNIALVILFVMGICGNIIGGIFNPASNSILPDIVDKEQLQKAESYFSAMNSIQGIAGVLLAGILYALLPAYILFSITGICYLASGMSEMFIKYDYIKSEQPLTLDRTFRNMKEGFVYLYGQKSLFMVLLMFTLINFFVTPINSNITPYFVKTDLQNAQSYLFDKVVTPEMWLSIFSICGGVASTVTAIVISKREQKDKFGKSMKIWITIFSGVIILIAVSYLIFVQKGMSLNAFIISFCIFSIFSAMICCQINIRANTAVLLTVDKDYLGKVMSLIGVAAQGLIPLASLISGIILNQYGIVWLLAFCAAGFVLTDVIVVSSRYVNEI